MKEIPQADYAIIGGSSTFSIDFPEDLGLADVKVVADNLIYETPYGKSPSFKLFTIADKNVLTVRMHGWRPAAGVSRADASKQLFWVLREAGVKRVFAEGGVGSINQLLELRDLVVVDDYIDFSMRQDVGLGSPYLLTMREPICPIGSGNLVAAAKRAVAGTERHVFGRGTYVNTDGRHFESRAEVQMFKYWQADVVGQSITPEVYLAREIGACYAGIYMVVNYAEGIIRDWEHAELSDIFYQESKLIGRVLVEAVRSSSTAVTECSCQQYRTATLLKEE
jgi:5'-methylthioadenosine phosphorylase